MEDEGLNKDKKFNEAVVALHSCQEVLGRFKNENYILWEQSIPASELLIGFSAVFAVVLKFLIKNDSAYADQVAKCQEELSKVLEKYKKKCIEDRMTYTY
jgi:hypothetical protein